MLCYFSGFLLRSQGISVILLICRNFSRSAPGRQSRAGGVTGKRSLLDVQGLRKNGVEQLVGILDGLHIGEHRQGLGRYLPVFVGEAGQLLLDLPLIGGQAAGLTPLKYASNSCLVKVFSPPFTGLVLTSPVLHTTPLGGYSQPVR